MFSISQKSFFDSHFKGFFNPAMSLPALDDMVADSSFPFLPSFPHRLLRARKPMRTNMKLSPPGNKAENMDENVVTDQDELNDSSHSSFHSHAQQTTSTPALSATRGFASAPRRKHLNFPSESDISALDIGPSLTQSHLQRSVPGRVSRAPIASPVGFLRVLPVTTGSNTSPCPGRSTEIRRIERPKSRLCIEDLESEAVTSGSASISPELLTGYPRRQGIHHSLPVTSSLLLSESIKLDRSRSGLRVDDFESEAVTSGGVSISPQLLTSRPRPQDAVHMLPPPSTFPRTWRRQVPITGDIHMVGYGYGYGGYQGYAGYYGYDISTHFDFAVNTDHENMTASPLAPGPRRASPPKRRFDPYPNSFTAGMADYERSLELYKRLEDDSKEAEDAPADEMNGEL